MVIGTIERLVSTSVTEEFDFGALFQEKAEEEGWTEGELAAAMGMTQIRVERSSTAHECTVWFDYEGHAYGVTALYEVVSDDGEGSVMGVDLEPLSIIYEHESIKEELAREMPDDLIDLLSPALTAIASEAW